MFPDTIVTLGKPPSHPGGPNDGETISPPFQGSVEYGDPSEEKLGGGNGSGGGGSFVRCSKCGGPLRAIEPSSSCKPLLIPTISQLVT